MSNLKHKILLVEDGKNLGNTLCEYLDSKGFSVDLKTTFKAAKEAFDSTHYSIVLMDIGLPDGDGRELAKIFRSIRKDFVLLFLSALNDPETKLEGLQIGADDYITKPFDLRELTLRLDRILQTSDALTSQQDEITLGSLKIWFRRYEMADSNGDIIALSQKECAILELLYSQMPQAVARDEIIEKVWGQTEFPSNRTVDNYIVKLRKWTDTDDKVNIQTIRGIGYKLEVACGQ